MANLFLYGQATNAQFLAFFDGESLPRPFDLEPGEVCPTPEEISNMTGRTCTRIEKRQKYYWLPLQPRYNQPDGTVDTISLFPTDYDNLKACTDLRATYPYWYLYDNYQEADRRALD